jgi:puromycin-sensitive aminopeptidase
MERLGVDAYREGWRAWDDFALGRAVALDTDALSNTRTVEYPVHTPEDADGMFDVLTYQKGGSVLRMLERWLGADAFRAGVRAYLDRYRLANTETTDLWDSLEEATGQPVRKIMDTWIFQPGFPLVTPHRDGDRVTLSQQRFSYVGGASPERWSIPVRARVERDGWSETRSLLLADADVTTEVPAGARVVLDAGGEGFYRVAYPAEWRAELLASGSLRPLERFSIVDDTWAAVLAGVTPADEVLALARQLRDEDDLVVWRLLISVLRGVARVVDGEALVALRGEIGLVLEPAAERLGRQPAAGDDARTRQLRGIVLDALGTLVEDPSVVAAARETYSAPGVDPDVAAASVVIAATAGDAATFDDYIARADAAATPQEQLRFLYALGTFPTEELVLRAVDLALSDAVRPQNGPFLIQRALRNRRHGPAAWVQVRDRWTEIRGRFSSSLVSRLLDGITWLVDDASMADVPRFLEANPVPEGARVIAQHLERQRVHRAVVDRERDRLSATLM